jgi:hypothetical protein
MLFDVCSFCNSYFYKITQQQQILLLNFLYKNKHKNVKFVLFSTIIPNQLIQVDIEILSHV